MQLVTSTQQQTFGVRASFARVSVQQKRASWRAYSCEGKNHPINPSIRKDEAKVVDIADVSQQEKNQVAYCRCWRSGTFPMCDGSHMKHNEAEGDNVGPLLVKK